MIRFDAIILAGALGAISIDATAADEPSGASLYADFCSVCHGDKGNGDSRAKGSMNPPPRNFTSADSSATLDRERMIDSVLNGRPGTAMTAWKHQLSREQTIEIVDYIRDRFMLPATTDRNNEGRRLYAEFCSVCHGDKGNGRSRASNSLSPPPRDFTNALAARELTLARITFSVKYGRPNTAMPSWGGQLDDAQIAAVVDYIRAAFIIPTVQREPVETSIELQSTSGGHQNKHGEMEMSAPFADGLMGDAERGKTFYNANCTACHGYQGDGRGPRAYFINPKPRDFHHPAARASLNRPHIYSSISEGKIKTEMPAWKHVIDPQEIANVAEYVFQTFIVADKTTATPHEPMKMEKVTPATHDDHEAQGTAKTH